MSMVASGSGDFTSNPAIADAIVTRISSILRILVTGVTWGPFIQLIRIDYSLVECWLCDFIELCYCTVLLIDLVCSCVRLSLCWCRYVI